MLVTVDLPIPDGWELAEPAMRQPLAGECWLDASGISGACCAHGPHWILRRSWTWPQWLKDGDLSWSETWQDWVHTTHSNRCTMILDSSFNWTPPPDKTKLYKSSDYRDKKPSE